LKAYDIRPATGNDLSFIYDTWLKSYRCDSALGKSCKKSVYFDEYKLVLDRILLEANTIIAHFTDDTDLILAYMVYEPGVIHYAFCKEAFRRLGIVTGLFKHAFPGALSPLYITHRTAGASPILYSKQFLVHNPFILFKKGVA
jgi:hypothetical protein